MKIHLLNCLRWMTSFFAEDVMISLKTPVTDEDIEKLKVGEIVKSGLHNF